MPAAPPRLEDVLGLLRAHAAGAERRYGLRIIGVVGSLARGEARPDSDIDVLADRTGRPSMFDIAAMEEELSQALGRKVDVIVRSGLAPHWREFADRELVAA
ncbi:MAG: nucleotidyltransferase family protein [Maricaulaceae bacterium]|nr:nucleotidyltransferase family protein [Maricaulaceae bacterium]